jgi:hypothetical protein
MLLEMQSLSFGKLFLANRLSLMWQRLQTKSYITECVPVSFPFPLLLISPLFIFFSLLCVYSLQVQSRV